MSVVYYPPDSSYMNFGPVLSSASPLNAGQQTTVRLNIYGSSLPPPSLASQPVTLNVNLVWNTLPTVAYSDVLPLDYDLEDYKVEFQTAVDVARRSGMAVFSKEDENKINEVITQPKIFRDQLLDANQDGANLLHEDIVQKLIDLKSQDLVIPKSLVIAHSTLHKNRNIENISNRYSGQ